MSREAGAVGLRCWAPWRKQTGDACAPVVARMYLLIDSVACELEHLHPITQWARDGLHLIGSGYEEHLRE